MILQKVDSPVRAAVSTQSRPVTPSPVSCLDSYVAGAVTWPNGPMHNGGVTTVACRRAGGWANDSIFSSLRLLYDL